MIDADEGHDNPPLQTPQMMKCEAVAADGTTKSSRRDQRFGQIRGATMTREQMLILVIAVAAVIALAISTLLIRVGSVDARDVSSSMTIRAVSVAAALTAVRCTVG